MAPAYRAGERLLVNRLAYVARAPRPGDVVVVRDPAQSSRLLLKRVAARSGGSYVVLGDNRAASRDSRHFGPLRRREIIGKVLGRY
ncbi:MAG: nickel-type superoxide dismutase maturation protease [Chloroflexi bacterium]|nr:nickel-type superoxide dismutase maturation protease [Chloroflexota bacterium]